MLELKRRCVCVRKIQYEGVCREANTAQGEPSAVLASRHPPSTVFFVHTSKAVL